MYIDKIKQKKANKEANRRYRLNQTKKNAPGLSKIDDSSTEGITVSPEKGITGITGITGKALPANYGLPDCTCKHCQSDRVNGGKHIINHGAYKPAEQLASNELNRVTLPGDSDYKGCMIKGIQ